jgi:hypothetical protein
LILYRICISIEKYVLNDCTETLFAFAAPWFNQRSLLTV